MSLVGDGGVQFSSLDVEDSIVEAGDRYKPVPDVILLPRLNRVLPREQNVFVNSHPDTELVLFSLVIRNLAVGVGNGDEIDLNTGI